MDAMQTDLILIQEPYYFKGIRGLGESGNVHRGGALNLRARACIFSRKGLNCRILPQFSDNDLTSCMLKYHQNGEEKQLIVCSAYLPYDQQVPTNTLVNVVNYCNSNNIEILIGCDANSHNIIWGSSDTNSRGNTLMNFIASSGLLILNEGNRPTFIDKRREEVIDITLCSSNILKEITGWHVSLENCMSDHQAIHFKMFADPIPTKFFRNPRKTNWKNYKIRLEKRMRNRKTDITSILILEQEIEYLTNAIISSYEESCPLKRETGKRKTPGWNNDLE
jgi:hypothetical protein